MTSQAADAASLAEEQGDEAFRTSVQAVLEEFVAEQAELTTALGEDAAHLVDAARTSVGGGKRLRALFCRAGFLAVRDLADDHEERALARAGAALELLHASALVHDDLIDASDTRRGRPATHRAFAARHQALGWPGDAEGYGAAAAILLGDLLLSWSDELLRRCGLPAATVLEALRVLDTTRTEVVLGQFLDVSVQARGDGDIDQAMRVLRYKSAKYSVERPLHVGATLAGGTPAQLQALSAYGVPLGEAFQLRDDLLGVFGDPEVTGKPAGDDLAEGKRTVLLALALGGLEEGESRSLDASVGRQLSADEVTAAQQAITRSGAAAEVERRIEELTARSLAALDAAPVRPESRHRLRALADAATRRSG